MKQIIIIAVALVLIIVLNVWQISYLKNTSKYILTDINDIKNSLNREDFEAVKRGVKELEKTWNMVKSGWDICGQHDDIENINKYIQSMKVYALYEEKINLSNECALFENEINHVIENESISFSNVL